MPEPAKRVLIVGGDVSHVSGDFSIKLREHGVDPAWHWEFHASDALPVGCEGVVVFHRMVNNGLAIKAKQLAKRADVPFAYAHLEWAKALPSLRVVGIIASKEVLGVTPRELYDAIYPYMVDEIKKGRTPSLSEAIGHGSKVLGQPITLPHGIYSRARTAALGEHMAKIHAVPQPVQEAPVEEVVPLDETPEWIRLLIETRPEDSNAEILSKLHEHVKGTPATLDTIEAARQELRAEWARDLVSPTYETRLRVNNMREEHAIRMLQHARDSGKRLPTREEIKANSTSVFGVSIPRDRAQQYLMDFRAKHAVEPVVIEPVIEPVVEPVVEPVEIKSLPTPEPIVAPPVPVEKPAYTMANTYNPQRAKELYEQMLPALARIPGALVADFQTWIAALDQTPGTKMPATIRKLLSQWAGKQFEFGIAFMYLLGNVQVIRGTMHAAYTQLTGKKLGPLVANAAGGGMDKTFRTLSNKEQGIRSFGSVRATTEGEGTPKGLIRLIAPAVESTPVTPPPADTPTLDTHITSLEQTIKELTQMNTDLKAKLDSAESKLAEPPKAATPAPFRGLDITAFDDLVAAGYTVTIEHPARSSRIVLQPK